MSQPQFQPVSNKRAHAWLDVGSAGREGSVPGSSNGNKKPRIGAPPLIVARQADSRTDAALVRDVLMESKGVPQRPDGIKATIFTRNKRVVDLDEGLIKRVLDSYPDILLNEMNGTLRWKDPLDLGNIAKLEEYIKRNSQQPGGVTVAFIRKNWPTTSSNSADRYQTVLERLESQGKILIMRGPTTGGLLPPGAEAKVHTNLFGYDKVKDSMMQAGSRAWRSVFWDDVRERKEAPVEALPSEFTQLWADVKIGTSEDIEEKLMTLGHTVSALDQAKKTAVRAPTRRKKVTKQREAKRLTNTHLLSLGIDLSKDYVPEE